jgi:ribosomal protein S18 acetylase RimI-like enzyme
VTTTHDDLRVQPLTLDDVGEVTGLFHRYDRRFFSEPLVDADDIAAEFRAPDFDLTTSSRGYRTAAGELVATVYLTPRGYLQMQFAEGWDTSALKRELVDFAEQLARERRMRSVSTFVAESDHDGVRFFADRGYTLHHTSWILGLDPETPIAGRVLPEGYAVRPFTPADAEATYRVIMDAFGEWDQQPQSFEVWRASTLDRPNVDPSAFRVATYAGEVIGAATVFDSAGEAWVAQLAVAPEHRRRGVAQQLLAETYAAARERGVPNAGLSTDTRTGALDLYLRLRMRVKFTLNNWELDLSGGGRACA